MAMQGCRTPSRGGVGGGGGAYGCREKQKRKEEHEEGMRRIREEMRTR